MNHNKLKKVLKSRLKQISTDTKEIYKGEHSDLVRMLNIANEAVE